MEVDGMDRWMMLDDHFQYDASRLVVSTKTEREQETSVGYSGINHPK